MQVVVSLWDAPKYSIVLFDLLFQGDQPTYEDSVQAILEKDQASSFESAGSIYTRNYTHAPVTSMLIRNIEGFELLLVATADGRVIACFIDESKQQEDDPLYQFKIFGTGRQAVKLKEVRGDPNSVFALGEQPSVLTGNEYRIS